jgi:cardiolipin synthase
MFAEVTGPNRNWMCTGRELFASTIAAIDAASQSVSLETYIYAADSVGIRVRDSLVRAQARGVHVRVLIDGLGSFGLPAAFWSPLREGGGEVRVFNPARLGRLGIRDHRKLLACDDRVAYVGGFNISKDYEGDGVSCGWCDLGLKIEGPLVAQLVASFDEMFAKADFQHKRFIRLRRSVAKKAVYARDEQLLLSGPGRGHSPIKRWLRRDLSGAKDVRIISAYFLPTWRLRRDLASVVARGGRVQLVLPGKSDVTVSQLAARSLYRRLLKGGIEVYEYQPQILHSKLIVMDDVVFVGSANLDPRSLNINYELMIRFENRDFAGEARRIFGAAAEHSKRIRQEDWRRSGSLWNRLKQHWAYFLLVRVDPYIARRQWKALPD